MTDEEKLRALNQILANIKKAISKYNDLNPSNPLTLNDDELKIDVSNLYICLVDESKVGLFEKKYWEYNTQTIRLVEDTQYTKAGYIYSGVNSNYVAIKRTFPDEYIYKKGERAHYTYYDSLVPNCIVSEELPFDYVRQNMFEKGIIATYTPGRASASEIKAVLNHAYNIPKDDELKR